MLALVGGYDFAHSKFNRAVQSRRQTGSSFKPFVYRAAFEKGLTPADTLFDAPIAIPVGEAIYAPKTYYGKYAGIVTIQRALELSINVPAVKTYMMTGGDQVVDFARRLGITADLPQYPSLSLGAAGVSPLEMTGAYNVFANSGVYMDLPSGRRGVGPCARVVMQAFVAGQEPDKNCSGASVQVAKLPYYLQRPMYQAKEGEPTQPAIDASAQSGESAESPAPATDTPVITDTITETPPATST